MLRQPISEILAGASRVLLAGCGGGYDVLGAVPLAVELLERGTDVRFASLSFCYLNALAGARQDPTLPNLYSVPAAAAREDCYCPEAWLARWLEEQLGLRQPVWAFDKTGAGPLERAYRRLVAEEQIDAVVLVDGGIDALLAGDESSLGTPAEDLCSLAAVARLELAASALACVALGAELRDGICHEQALRRMAELQRHGGFLGACALARASRAGGLYRDAVDFVLAHQAAVRRSHVHRVLRAALDGEYGADGPHIWISPLMCIYWFFSLATVARTHRFLDALAGTETIWDVVARIEAEREELAIRERSVIPI
jgi:hypothetical protein